MPGLGRSVAWCKLDDTFCDDPKLHALAAALDVPFYAVAGHLAILWSWALRHAPDGMLPPHCSEREIARIMHYGGDPQTLVKTLLQHQILEMDDESKKIHGYGERSESYNRSKQKKNWRERQTVSGPSPDRLVNVGPRGEERRREEKRGEEKDLNTLLCSSHVASPAMRLWAPPGDVAAKVISHVPEAGKELAARLLGMSKPKQIEAWLAGSEASVVAQELLKAYSWAQSVPGRRYTPRFFNTWLSNCQSHATTTHSNDQGPQGRYVPNWEESQKRLREREAEFAKIREENKIEKEKKNEQRNAD